MCPPFDDPYWLVEGADQFIDTYSRLEAVALAIGVNLEAAILRGRDQLEPLDGAFAHYWPTFSRVGYYAVYRYGTDQFKIEEVLDDFINKVITKKSRAAEPEDPSPA